MVFALVSDRFQPTPNSEVAGSKPNPRVQIFPPEYGAFGIFVCLIMFQDKNWVVAPPVTPKGRGGDRTQNLMIILKILLICNLNLKINLKIIIRFKGLVTLREFGLTDFFL
jgi:hypothetical protein